MAESSSASLSSSSSALSLTSMEISTSHPSEDLATTAFTQLIATIEPQLNGSVNYNTTNSTNHMELYEYPPLLLTGFNHCIIPIVFGIIFIVGLIGNGTLIYIVARNKSLRNTPNIFIVSLASGDLLLVFAAIPFVAFTVFTFSYWPYGSVMCKLMEFMQTLSLGVSVFTLVALSGDRYVAIVYPMSKHKGSPTLRTGIIAGGIWILAALLAIMDLVQTELEVLKFNETHEIYDICIAQSRHIEDVYARFRTLFRFCVYFAIPVVIISTFYVLMARILVLSLKQMPGDSKNCSQATRQFEARKKVAKLVLSFVLIFVLCWLPYHIYYIWFYFLPGDFNTFWLIFKMSGICMGFINSCVNPFALYFLSKEFRKNYNRFLFCCCVKPPPRPKGEFTTTLYHFNSSAGRTRNSFTILTSKSVC